MVGCDQDALRATATFGVPRVTGPSVAGRKSAPTQALGKSLDVEASQDIVKHARRAAFEGSHSLSRHSMTVTAFARWGQAQSRYVLGAIPDVSPISWREIHALSCARSMWPTPRRA